MLTPENMKIIRPLAKKLGEAIDQALTNDKKIDSCMEEIKAAGFEMILGVELTIGVIKTPDGDGGDREVHELVVDGVVSPDAFIADDDKFLKSFKISLDDKI